MEEDLGQPSEYAYVLIGEVVSEGLTIVLIAQDADQTETIHSPLLHPLTLLSQAHALQHPGQLPAAQLNHTHIIHLGQLLLESSDQLLRNIHCPLIQQPALSLIPLLHSIFAILGDLQYGGDSVEQLVKGKVISVGDDALQITAEVLDIEQLAAVDLPLHHYVADVFLHLNQAAETDDILH
jgi:hypothetical protein